MFFMGGSLLGDLFMFFPYLFSFFMGSLLGDLLMFFHQELKNTNDKKRRMLEKKLNTKKVEKKIERCEKNKEDLHSFYYDWFYGTTEAWEEEKEFDEWMKAYMPDDDEDDDDAPPKLSVGEEAKKFNARAEKAEINAALQAEAWKEALQVLMR